LTPWPLLVLQHRHLEEEKSQLFGNDCGAAKISYKSISIAVTISAIP
jgi:hypothetical protein